MGFFFGPFLKPSWSKWSLVIVPYMLLSRYTPLRRQKTIVNSNLTRSVQIQKSTRQGRPLSTLLFILSLEVLLNQIRTSHGIKSFKIKGFQFKLQAFADDLLIIMEEPNESIILLCQLLDQYGQVWGCKINKGHTF